MNNELIEALKSGGELTGILPGSSSARLASWYLIGYLPGARQVITIHLEPQPFTIGRGTKTSYCLPRDTVSSTHAEFHLDNGLFGVRDLNSTNGTFVNGERISSHSPIRHNDLVQFGDLAFRVVQRDRVSDHRTVCRDVEDEAIALVQFDRLFADNAIVPYFQAIVDIQSHGEVVGYEALSRSRLVGLETPQQMFAAASKLNLEVELSRIMRAEALRRSSNFPKTPHVFLNTHPSEVSDDGLIESIKGLRKVAPSTPITIEIHESIVTNLDMLKELRDVLCDLDMRFAFDDFGAGQARLMELVAVRPDYLKFDRSILQDIHHAPVQRQKMLDSLVKMTKELGIIPLAEGIECAEENEVCRQIGFELAQGFFHGKPVPIGR